MEDAVQFFVEQGSYGLMIAALIAAGLGVPFPEDIVMISGAILAQRGITDLWLTVGALAIGVFAGDTALFFLAKRLGPAIYEWRWIKRVLPEDRRRWIEEKIAKHGGKVVFLARHVAGFRGPTFAIAAIHGISYWRFILWDMLALAVSLPLWMALGWFFADRIDEALAHATTAERAVTFGIIGVVVLGLAIHFARTIIRSRRVGGVSEARPSTAPAAPSGPTTGDGSSAS